MTRPDPSDPPDPRVSVVIPTYNRAALLERAVGTVLEQTWTDFELVVFDDGSTDDTPAAMARMTDPRIVKLRGPNEGCASARNRALAVARGEWVAFLDDDNEWRPEYLDRQLASVADAPDAVVVYCLAELRKEAVDEDSWERFPVWCPDGDMFPALLAGWWAPISGMMVRRDALRETGGFAAELDTHEDVDLMMRMARRGSYVCDPEVLIVRNEHPAQGSRDLARQARSVRALDQRWRRRIVASEGLRAYLRWIALRHRQVTEQELARLYAAPVSEQRGAAHAAVRRLATQLPWSATALVRAALLAAVGPAAFASARSRWRRARSRVRSGVRPAAGEGMGR
ncbi:MAG: glycosyltransferase family 2 protein [Acidimicrobiia bacterium]